MACLIGFITPPRTSVATSSASSFLKVTRLPLQIPALCLLQVIRRSMAWRDMQGLVTDILGQPAMVAYDNGVGVDLAINTEQVRGPLPDFLFLSLSLHVTLSFSMVVFMVLLWSFSLSSVDSFGGLCALVVDTSISLAPPHPPPKHITTTPRLAAVAEKRPHLSIPQLHV